MMHATHNPMILHLMVGTLLLAVLATTLFRAPVHAPALPPAFVATQQSAAQPRPGIAGIFGRGPAVRNLIF